MVFGRIHVCSDHFVQVFDLVMAISCASVSVETIHTAHQIINLQKKYNDSKINDGSQKQKEHLIRKMLKS